MARHRPAFWFGLVATSIVTNPSLAEVGPMQQAFHQGRYKEALTRWESVLPALKGHERVDTLLRMAASYQALGRVEKAFSLLKEAHALAEGSRDKARRALVLGSLSDGYLLARRLDAALDYAEQAVSMAGQAAAPAVVAAALNHLGNALMAQERYSEALRAYREGIGLAEQAPDPAIAAALMTNTVHVHLASDTPAEAIPILTVALTTTRALPPSRDKAYGLIGLGHLAQRLAVPLTAQRDQLTQTAYQAFTEARTLAQQLRDVRANAYATGHLGELYVVHGRHPEAERLLHQALFFAAEAQAPELSARWQWQLGRSLKARGRIEEAKTAYRQSLDQLGPIQSALVFGQRGNPRSFRETVGVIYLELAEMLLEEAEGASDETARHGALHEVRDVMEGFKTVELQNYHQDECVTELQQRVSKGKIDQMLGVHTATLYPIMFPERLVLLASFSNASMHYVSVEVEATELRTALSAFREQLTVSDNSRGLRKHGQALYEWLIKPIAPELRARAIDTLVVIPDDILRMIPFSALFDGEDFLVNRYAFAVTPGLSLTDPGVVGRGGREVLLGGLSESVQGFEQLPYVRDEISQIAALYGGTQLMDQAFRKEKIRTELRRTPYSVIHFATHAQIQADPRQSFLVTYDDQITLDELERFVRISQFRKQPVDLMVLSACETAKGDERAALGLAGVAVKAGARSVMASLWAVNDASTAQLVPLFFKNLKDPALNKAQALQRAQQHLLAETEYRHPFYWAAFVLIGNWL